MGIQVGQTLSDGTGKWETPDPAELLRPVIRTMPMGWTWALHFANTLVSDLVAQSAGASPSDTFKERSPAPQLVPGSTAVGVYVDNVSMLSATRGSSTARLRGIVEEARRRDIPLHLEAEGVSELRALGVVFDLRPGERKVRHSADRLWKLVLASKALLKRSRLRGEVMERWLGCAVNILALARPAMSCLWHCYKFARFALGEADRGLNKRSARDPRSNAACLFGGG